MSYPSPNVVYPREWTRHENVEALRGAIAQSVPKWLREYFTVLLPMYRRTFRLMTAKGAVRSDLMGVYAFPIDYLLRRSVALNEGSFTGSYTNFEPNNTQGLRGIADLAREENQGFVVRYQPMQRKLETAIDWYTQDIVLNDSTALMNQMKRRMARLIEGHATEVNEFLWNFGTLANGGAWGDSGVTAIIEQQQACYSIPFLVNTPRFARIATFSGGSETASTRLKAFIPSNLVLSNAEQQAVGYFSHNTTIARRQDVGGLRRGTIIWQANEGVNESNIQEHRYFFWNVPIRAHHTSRSPRRVDHIISGLEAVTAPTVRDNTGGDGIANTAGIAPANVRISSLSHLRLVQLYNNLLANDMELPDVLMTHPQVLAWMENQAWTTRRFTESMKQVFGMNVAFFLDVPIMVDPLIEPVSHTADLTFNGGTVLPANTPLYHLYFLRFGENGIEMMLNMKRDIEQRPVPVPSDYYMGAYYVQHILNNPMTAGAALSFRLD